jgi:sentrin-specific protease 7
MIVNDIFLLIYFSYLQKADSHVEEALKTAAATLSCANCPFCGSDNVLSSKCLRCSRPFGKQDLSNGSLSPTLEEQSKRSSPISNDKSNRRLRPQNIRQKFQEPQCVTLSSDEEEKVSYPECKKPREDFDVKREKSVDLDSSLGIGSQAKMVADRLDTTKHLQSPLLKSEHNLNTIGNNSIKEEVDDELSHKTESIIKGPFIPLNCRSVRIGSFKVSPTSPVLISVEGIELRVPDIRNQSTVTVTIFSKQLLQFEAHLNRNLYVIFLYVTPTVSRKFSQKLGLQKNSPGPYWDSLSTVDSQRRMTLFLDNCDETTKNSIKQSFTPLGVFKEITYIEANQILVNSLEETVQNCSQAQTESVLLPQPSKNSTSNKENGFLKEVFKQFLIIKFIIFFSK